MRRSAFQGTLYLVNPGHASLNDLPVHPNVASLPETPDLAIIATPPDQVPALIAELGARGTKAAVVISAGFAELGEQGQPVKSLPTPTPFLRPIVTPLRVLPRLIGVMA